MILSLKGASLRKLVRHNGPTSQGLPSPAGPEEISSAPGDHEINTRAAGPGSLPGAETSGREPSLGLFVLKTQEALVAGVWVSAPLNASFQTAAPYVLMPSEVPGGASGGGGGLAAAAGVQCWEGGSRARAEGRSVPQPLRTSSRTA